MGQAKRRGTFEERKAQAIAFNLATETAVDQKLSEMSATETPISRSQYKHNQLMRAAMLSAVALGIGPIGPWKR